MQALAEWQGGQLGCTCLPGGCGSDALEHLQELGQRIVIVGAAIMDQIERHLTLLFRDPVHREDLGGMHDGRVETRFDCLMEEDGVEDHARGRIQPERDVRDAERGPDSRIALLEFTNRVQRLEAVAASLFLTGADGERQRVNEDVANVHSPVAGQLVDQAGSDPYLPFGRPGLALFVDGERDDARPVFLDEWHDALEPRVGPVAVLEVHRVDDRASRELLESCLEDLGFRRVEHDRQGHGGGQAACELLHVRNPIPADVVDAEVEHVRPVAGLGLGDVDAVIEPSVEHGFAEGLRTVRVGAFADAEIAQVLRKWHIDVEGADRILEFGLTLPDLDAAEALGKQLDVFRGGAAAATDE